MVFLKQNASRQNSDNDWNQCLADSKDSEEAGCCVGSASTIPSLTVSSTKSKARWFNARRSRSKRRSLMRGCMLFASSKSSRGAKDAATVTLGITKNETSCSFPPPERHKDHTTTKNNSENENENLFNSFDHTVSTAEEDSGQGLIGCSDGEEEFDSDSSFGSLSTDDCFGVRFDLSRTQYRDDTVRSMDCEMELYDCWYNRMATTNFKMDQRQAADELFEANENDNVENTHAQRILHWRQTLHAAFLESHERPQDRQQEESSSLFLEGTEESSSSESESESVLSCLEQLYADEDAAALLIGLEFDVLARLSGRPNKKARAILDLLQQAGHDDCEATTAVASQIAILSAPTLRFSRTVALAQAKVVQHMQQQQH